VAYAAAKVISEVCSCGHVDALPPVEGVALHTRAYGIIRGACVVTHFSALTGRHKASRGACKVNMRGRRGQDNRWASARAADVSHGDDKGSHGAAGGFSCCPLTGTRGKCGNFKATPYKVDQVLQPVGARLRDNLHGCV
jgi:hypothetical protein